MLGKIIGDDCVQEVRTAAVEVAVTYHSQEFDAVNTNAYNLLFCTVPSWVLWLKGESL